MRSVGNMFAAPQYSDTDFLILLHFVKNSSFTCWHKYYIGYIVFEKLICWPNMYNIL